MEKTIKIDEGTHRRLQSVGTMADTFDNAIRRLLDVYEDSKNIILQVRISGEKRKIYLGNPLYDWTDENYDAFLTIAFNMDREWRRNILKRIAQNNEWYKEVQEYRRQTK